MPKPTVTPTPKPDPINNCGRDPSAGCPTPVTLPTVTPTPSLTLPTRVPNPTSTPEPTSTPGPTAVPGVVCTGDCNRILNDNTDFIEENNDQLNWHQNVPISQWDGVFLNRDGDVFIINLSNRNLTGELPENLGDLSSLQILDLSQNGFTGHIPDSYNGLRDDAIVLLRGNDIEGCVPGHVYQLPRSDARDIGLDVCVPDHQTISTNSDCYNTVDSHDTETATTSDHVGISLRVGGYVGTSDQLERQGKLIYGYAGGDPDDYDGVHPCYGAQVQVMSSVTSTSVVTVSGYYQNQGETEYPTEIRPQTRVCMRTSCLLDGSYQLHTENHSPLNGNPDDYVAYFYADVEYLGSGTMEIETAGVTISGHNPQMVVPLAPPRMGTVETEVKGRTEVKLSWGQPTGSVRYYNVQYRARGDRWGNETEDLEDRHITIDDLECGTTYEFRVRAKSGGDEWYDIWGVPSVVEETVVTERC